MNKEYQKLLFPYAYNILGSADEALDAVQDVLLKFLTFSKKEGISDEWNYLIRSVINRAINIRNRKKELRQDDVWLPEPIATERADSDVYLKDILSYSLLVLLERLTAQERAVFILRESFDYSHQDIAETLNISEDNSRKLLSRAKRKLKVNTSEVCEPNSKKATAAELLEKYIGAIRSKEIANVEELLAEDILFYADGGTKLNVVKKMCVGARDVAELLVFVYNNYQVSYRISVGEVNHQPAMFYYDGSQLKACQIFETSSNGKRITQINSVVDPDKIKHLHLQ
ncbi:sigma-70 family RNA polymerase sigma factor [Parapedobacter deserti]|uniref:Sigma-70 family RNA polymerase sigma factor n=1 Tax=Parapedobacter deserti TaxID=1912957 RepID=A0ABV7JFX8_9SPHI